MATCLPGPPFKNSRLAILQSLTFSIWWPDSWLLDVPLPLPPSVKSRLCYQRNAIFRFATPTDAYGDSYGWYHRMILAIVGVSALKVPRLLHGDPYGNLPSGNGTSRLCYQHLLMFHCRSLDPVPNQVSLRPCWDCPSTRMVSQKFCYQHQRGSDFSNRVRRFTIHCGSSSSKYQVVSLLCKFRIFIHIRFCYGEFERCFAGPCPCLRGPCRR